MSPTLKVGTCNQSNNNGGPDLVGGITQSLTGNNNNINNVGASSSHDQNITNAEGISAIQNNDQNNINTGSAYQNNSNAEEVSVNQNNDQNHAITGDLSSSQNNDQNNGNARGEVDLQNCQGAACDQNNVVEVSVSMSCSEDNCVQKKAEGSSSTEPCNEVDCNQPPFIKDFNFSFYFNFDKFFEFEKEEFFKNNMAN